MKVTGFTFIRNAVKYDYPVVEAIQSVLPICDDFVVAVGRSDDDTLALIRGIAPDKIRIVETVWDDSLRTGGRVLAVETDKAFAAIAADTDWCFYIQGDEVVHEQYLPNIRAAMLANLHNTNIDGLLFHYQHFYGSYQYVGDSLRWYRREIRVIRNNKTIFSYRDAQGFRKQPNEKLRVKLIDAYIYHYGWVREPKAMQKKQEDFSRLWHDENWVAEHIQKADEFDYSQVDSVAPFAGTHPAVMQARIARKQWDFSFEASKKRFTAKEKFKRLVERLTGYRLGEYKNYRLVN